MELLSTTGNFLLILFGFGFLIFVHELGHFLAARWAGIRVDCFAIGMGPTMVSFRKGIGLRLGSTDRDLVARCGKSGAQLSDAELASLGLGETEYTLRALPLGGYVRMVGQEDANPSAVSDSPRGYQRCSIGKRMVVVSAGVIMNLITAVVLFWIAFAVGVQFPAPIVGRPMPKSPAALAAVANHAELSADERAAIDSSDTPTGLRPGDRITSIDGDAVATFADIQLAAAMAKPGATLDVRVQREGFSTELAFAMVPERDKGDGLLKLGTGNFAATSPHITNVAASQAEVVEELHRVGLTELRPGATLLAVNGRPVRSYDELFWIVRTGDGSALTTTWALPGTGGEGGERSITLTPVPTYEPLSIPQSVLTVGATPKKDAPPFAVSGLLGLSPLVGIAQVMPGRANSDILKAGDVILKAGSTDGPNFAELRAMTTANAGKTLELTLLRDGAPVQVTATVSNDGVLGFTQRYATELPYTASPVRQTLASSQGDAPESADEATKSPPLVATPAAEAGIRGGLRLSSVNGQSVHDWPTFREALRRVTAESFADDQGATVQISVENDTLEASNHTINLSAGDVKTLHGLGWVPPIDAFLFDPNFVLLKAAGPLEAVSMGLHETKKMIQQVYLTIDRLIRGSIGIDKLNGPVGIFHIGVKVADQGFTFLIFFVAVLSVNLAVMNFLPLPIVDGGLFLFLIYEKLTGRPPSIAFQNAATAVGLLLIGSIFVITFFNDVARLIG
jgi:regulator of sigma E protease